MQYPPTELVLNAEGKVYHLSLLPEQIGSKIILVGDQARVALVASLFERVEHSSQYREFACQTGIYKGKRITVLSTGIGTDNIDIVMNELDALVNIDLTKREDKPIQSTLEIVRIGTCGIVQPEIPVHSFILSSHAFGLDNVAHFYDINRTQEEIELGNLLSNHLKLPEGVVPYLSRASDELNNRLRSHETVEGITVTSSGFYGPQGRELRLKNKTSTLNEQLTSFRSSETRVLNFEMESSALFALGKALGHECTSICLGIANRPAKQFSDGYNVKMLELIEYVLERI